MNEDPRRPSLDELEASRALDDEFDPTPPHPSASSRHPDQSPIPLDHIVAALELTSTPILQAPQSLRKKLTASLPPPPLPRPSPWILWSGWATAAAIALAWLLAPGRTPASAPASPPQMASLSLSMVSNSITGFYGTISWNEATQSGTLNLSGISPNDPATSQFQLWIVDPNRDEFPVDGGVFDISRQGPITIPFQAKLSVHQPTTFVITEEKPGGVVRSKQEKVIAVATRN